ncbi:hypothetical protein SDC9_133544 [bioreactor metagenome]|uniref:Uncharacterized protein n=1 Tax=bioreactor metagenome TaxID=1076179 RepID=A0A645DB35_9ZZZZ
MLRKYILIITYNEYIKYTFKMEESKWKIKCFVFNVKKQQDVQAVQNLEYVENHQI